MDLQLTNCIAVFLHLSIYRYQCDDLESCKLLVHKKCEVSQHVTKTTDFISNFVDKYRSIFCIARAMLTQ